MKRTFMVVGGVPSKVITLGGKGVEDAPKRLVLIIPGTEMLMNKLIKLPNSTVYEQV